MAAVRGQEAKLLPNRGNGPAGMLRMGALQESQGRGRITWKKAGWVRGMMDGAGPRSA
jgi:hypothetical protein